MMRILLKKLLFGSIEDFLFLSRGENSVVVLSDVVMPGKELVVDSTIVPPEEVVEHEKLLVFG